MKRIKYLLILFTFLLTGFTLMGMEYFVSNTGNGSLMTLLEAKEAVRNFLNQGRTENVVIYMEDGNYILNSPLLFTNSDSGNNNVKITYKKQDPGSPGWPVISTGREISGWTPSPYANVSSVPVNMTFNTLYENNVRGTKKGYPQDINAAGDFCIDGGFLYYYSRNGLIDDQLIIVPATDSLIEIRGNSPQDPVRNISFEGIVFSTTDYNSSFTAAPGAEKALFTIENGHDISITGCKILNAGNTGILVDKGSRGIIIGNNRIDGFGINGISITGLAAGDTTDNSILGNLITRGYGTAGTGAGINLYQSGSNIITGNTISRLSGTGIRLAGMSNPANTKQNTVSYNRIFNIRANSRTAAGIYAVNTGTGNNYENNAIYELLNLDDTCTISGIFLDRKTDESTVQNNLLYAIHDISGNNHARPLNLGAAKLTINNNIIALNDILHDIFYNNRESTKDGTIKLTRNVLYTPGGRYFHYFQERNFISLAASSGNIIYHPGGKYNVKLPPGTDTTFSTWNNNYAMDKDSFTDKDPQFQEPASGLFRITNTKLARDAGFTDLNLSTGIPAAFTLYHATDRIEAENCHYAQGLLKRETNIQCPGNDSHIGYSRVYFPKNIKYANIRLSTNSAENINLGTTLEIHSGSANGLMLGSIQLTGTGGLGKYKNISLGVTVAEGTHDLYLVFRGNNADRIQVDWFEFYSIAEPVVPEQQAPYVEIITPDPDTQVLVGQPVRIDAWGLDDGTITNMEIFINDESKAWGDTNNIKYDWIGSKTGEYTVRVEATDNDGKTGSRSFKIYVKTRLDAGPEVTIAAPEDGAYIRCEQYVDIVVEARNPKSPVRVVEFYINGSVMFFDYEAPYIYTWFAAQPGETNIMVNAIDQKGYCTYKDIMVLVNNTGFILGHWTFDTYDGDTALDSSGNEYHGKIRNAYSAQGINGAALNFEGDGLVGTEFGLLNDRNEFTMAGWIKPGKLTGRIGFWGQDGVVEFGFNGKKIIQLWTKEGGILDYEYSFNPDEWHHIAAIGTGEALNLYVDGLPAATTIHSTASYGSFDSSAFNIGGAVFDPEGNGFYGLIDDVYVYRKAITDAEVKWLARKGGNALPVIKIITPVPDSQLNSPSDIRIKVMASDKDSGIKRIDYYVDNEFLGTSDTVPYDYNWGSVKPGYYSLRGTAVDNEDATASDTVFFVVLLPDYPLIGYWNFNDSNDTRAYDQSIYNNHGAITNGTIVTGINGNALYLQGDGAVITKNRLLSNLRAFTLAGWIKPETANTRTGFWGQDGVVEFGFGEAQTVTVWTLGGYVSKAYPFPMNEWHHIAAVGSSSSLRLYFDGKMVASNSQKMTNYGNTPWTFNIGGGGIFDSSGNHFTGAIDEVYAYRKALTEDEIRKLATIDTPGQPQVMLTGLTEGMTIYYPFIATLTAEIINNNCAANTVEFFINNELVFTDPEFPYEYIWNMDDKPDKIEFLITAKLASQCGFRDDHSLTIYVASTEELKKQYALETGIFPGNDKDSSAQDTAGKKQKPADINYYPRLTNDKTRSNSQGHVLADYNSSSSRIKEKAATAEKKHNNVHSNNIAANAGGTNSTPVRPWNVPTSPVNPQLKAQAENPIPGYPQLKEPGAGNNRLVVHPVIRKISQAGIIIFLLAGILSSVLLVIKKKIGVRAG